MIAAAPEGRGRHRTVATLALFASLAVACWVYAPQVGLRQEQEMSCRVGCSQKAPKTEASELAEAVSDTAKAMAGYKKGAAKLGAAATHSLQKDQQQLAEEMADGARESGKAFEQTFNLNPPPEGYEVVTTCADVDEEGHCWKTTNELQKPVRFEDAEPTDLNIKLGDSCTQELLDTFFANQVSKVVTYAMANAAESENVRSAMPVASLRGARCCGEREREGEREERDSSQATTGHAGL